MHNKRNLIDELLSLHSRILAKSVQLFTRDRKEVEKEIEQMNKKKEELIERIITTA